MVVNDFFLLLKALRLSINPCQQPFLVFYELLWYLNIKNIRKIHILFILDFCKHFKM